MRIGDRHRHRARTAVVALAAAALTAGIIAAAKAPAASSAAHRADGSPSISKEFFGSTVEPYTGKTTPTYRYTLTNGRGVSIQLLSYGAITQAIYVPGQDGQVKDVVLGFATLADYVAKDSPPVTANGGPYSRSTSRSR